MSVSLTKSYCETCAFESAEQHESTMPLYRALHENLDSRDADEIYQGLTDNDPNAMSALLYHHDNPPYTHYESVMGYDN